MRPLETMVAIAQLRLRLEMIERNPQLLEGTTMALKIRKPIELAGLKSRMIRAEGQEKTIAGLGKRYDDVQDGIDECLTAHVEHVADLETYHADLRRKIEGMVGSNGDPLDDGTGLASGDQETGQVISSKTKA